MLLNIFQIIKNFLINIFHWIKSQITTLEPASQKVDAALLITVLAITLPLDAFVYWRLFCEYFGKEYFTFCFSVDDIAYILYYKGTFYWYIMILLTIPAIPLLFNIPKIYKAIAIAVLFIIVSYLLVYSREFDLFKLIIYGVLVFLQMYLYTTITEMSYTLIAFL